MTRPTEQSTGAPPPLVLAGPAPARRERLDALERQARTAGETALRASLALWRGGPWAGPADLVRAILPDLEREAPELLERHRYELALALPELRQRFPLSQASLTDSVPVAERVRSYPMDRAFRLVHGLIDLLASWLGSRPAARAWIALDDFDEAGALGRRFVHELDRRLRPQAALRLVLGCAADAAASGAIGLPGVEVERLAGSDDDEELSPAAAEAEAEALEALLEGDLRRAETEAPRLVRLWELCGQPQRAVRWRVTLLAIYNHFGYYEDALAFGEGVLPGLDEYLRGERVFSRWHVLSGLFNGNVALGRPERALELLETEVLPKVTDLTDLISVHYAMSMLHARFLPKKDLALAEQHLRTSLSYAERAPLGDGERAYLQAFNWNGLAFIRHLQGHPDEALELCQRGLDNLRLHLSSDQHRLHRSVLFYNIAQVHASLRNLPAAIESYTAAMEIDPNYSEYYNDRGSAYLGLGRAEEAVRDLLRAIELSAPYPEVWINLGQAYRQLGRDAEAVDAYSRALELKPDAVIAWIGRAQARARLGAREEAIADYGQAIAREPGDPLVLSNRGALLYDLGRYEESLADLESAVALDPENPDLQENLAIALAAVEGAQGGVAVGA